MNSKALNFIKNFSYTLTSNLISMIISTLVVIIVPKLIGVEEYGYWQLYLFYTTYVGFLHFGWNDGIYLRYGGKDYKELDKKLFFSQFYMQVIFQIIIAVVIMVGSSIFIVDTKKVFILEMTAICMVIVNLRYMLLFILEGTNRFKEYSRITIVDRILYCILIIGLLLIGIREYKLMIMADLVGKSISLIYASSSCKEIVFRPISKFYFSLREAVENISVGIKLMFANIASMLIIGVVRFAIEHTWDVNTFGKVSLTLSISNLMMLFINAVGTLMFPILRRTDKRNLPSIYVVIRDFLMIASLGVLMIYYPLKIVLLAWLPKYADSLKYMALVFPMFIFEGKMAILINTYLKTLRREKMMLKINLISLCLSTIITLVTTIILKNLNLVVFSIVLILAFRCIISEIVLSKIFTISLYKDIFMELLMTLIFILTGWFINSWFAVLLYVVAYIMYFTIKRKDISYSIRNVKILTKA